MFTEFTATKGWDAYTLSKNGVEVGSVFQAPNGNWFIYNVHNIGPSDGFTTAGSAADAAFGEGAGWAIFELEGRLEDEAREVSQ